MGRMRGAVADLDVARRPGAPRRARGADEDIASRDDTPVAKVSPLDKFDEDDDTPMPTLPPPRKVEPGYRPSLDPDKLDEDDDRPMPTLPALKRKPGAVGASAKPSPPAPAREPSFGDEGFVTAR